MYCVLNFGFLNGVELADLLPGIINQMGPNSLNNLKRMAAQMQVRCALFVPKFMTPMLVSTYASM